MIAPWTHHIRVTKENCFTSKLRDLVVSGKPFTVRYDGPFGTPPRFLDPSDIHTAIIIVGGIGCTPMMSMLAYINSQVLAHGPGVLGGLSKIKVLWSAQMPAFFDIFADTIKSLQKTCPDRIEFQLYCSARTPKTQVKAVEMQPVKPSSNLDIISGRMDVEKTIKITSEAANRKKVSVFVCGPPMIVQEASKTCLELYEQGFPVEFEDTVFEF